MESGLLLGNRYTVGGSITVAIQLYKARGNPTVFAVEPDFVPIFAGVAHLPIKDLEGIPAIDIVYPCVVGSRARASISAARYDDTGLSNRPGTGSAGGVLLRDVQGDGSTDG